MMFFLAGGIICELPQSTLFKIVGRSSAVMRVELCIYMLIYVHFNSTLGERVL